MSHFTEVKTKLKSKEMIRRTLKELNINFLEEDGLKITNFFDDQLDVDIKIPTNTKYDIGIKKTDNNEYELSADWELLDKMKYNSEEFKKNFLQKYSYLTVKDQLEEQGFTLEEEHVDEEGNIQLNVCKW